MNDTVKRLMALADEHAHWNRWEGEGQTKVARQALEDELLRLFTPLNQCDGCMAGQPLRNGLHIDTDGKALMLCQESRYRDDNKLTAIDIADYLTELSKIEDGPFSKMIGQKAAACLCRQHAEIEMLRKLLDQYKSSELRMTASYRHAQEEIQRLQSAASDPQLLTSDERIAAGDRILMMIKHDKGYVK